MNKKTPVSTVRKPRKTARRKTSRKKKQPYRGLPHWVHILIRIAIVILFASGFYYFFIRPYAYRWKPCSGYQEYGVCMPSGYTVHGIDISHYQGNIDWKKVSSHISPHFPIKFVFVKATEGGDLGDDKFAANFESARNNGYIRGAYHFFNPETSGLKQAEFFINTVRLDSGDLPPVLDVEKKGRRNMDELKRELKIWLDRVESHYHVKPILYTSHKFKTRYLNDSLFNSYPYWIAHYYVDSVAYKGSWKFWQHTDVGSIGGISESVDLNIFNGTLEELKGMTIGR